MSYDEAFSGYSGEAKWWKEIWIKQIDKCHGSPGSIYEISFKILEFLNRKQ